MDKKDVLQKMQAILDEAASLEEKRKVLLKELQDICPIKPGDKVEIVNIETNAHIRFAFVRSIDMGASQGKGRMVWNMDKCKKDGSKSHHNDYLGYREVVKKIVK